MATESVRRDGRRVKARVKARDEAEVERWRRLAEKVWERQHGTQTKDDRSSFTACRDEGGIDTTNTEGITK